MANVTTICAVSTQTNTLSTDRYSQSFSKKFKKYFIIKVSPSLEGGSLMGATIMIGEPEMNIKSDKDEF